MERSGPILRAGVDDAYDTSYDRRFDLLVEAEPGAVLSRIVAEPEAFRVESFDIGEGPGSDPPIAVLFRLPDSSWTQVFGTVLPRGSLALARRLSIDLATRVLLVEATGDLWGGYALFDRGSVSEISWLCVHDDLRRIGSAIGIETPAFPDDELYDEVELFRSSLPSRDAADLGGLVLALGGWLDAGVDAAERGAHGAVHLSGKGA